MQCRRPQFNSWVRKICWRRDRLPTPVFLGFPCDSAGKESACNAWDLGLIPGLERSLGEGKGYPLQYSPWGHKELDMIEQLSLYMYSLLKASYIGCIHIYLQLLYLLGLIPLLLCNILCLWHSSLKSVLSKYLYSSFMFMQYLFQSPRFLPVLLRLKWVSVGCIYICVSCFCICSATLCLLNWAFSLFTFKIIINKYILSAIF